MVMASTDRSNKQIVHHSHLRNDIKVDTWTGNNAWFFKLLLMFYPLLKTPQMYMLQQIQDNSKLDSSRVYNTALHSTNSVILSSSCV